MTAEGAVELVNTLGIEAASQAELFEKLESADPLAPADCASTALPASDRDYCQKVCQVDTGICRYNADTHGPVQSGYFLAQRRLCSLLC